MVNSTGVGQSGAGGVIQSSASVYLAIGNSIPTPAPETIQEVRVNASMYDAQQGATQWRAHRPQHIIGHQRLSTARLTCIAAPTGSMQRHSSSRTTMRFPTIRRIRNCIAMIAGGTFGGPIIKNKLFGFVAYQHLHVSDEEIGDSFLNVPVGLSDTTRDAGNFAQSGECSVRHHSYRREHRPRPLSRSSTFTLSLPGEPGKWLVPNDTGSANLSPTHAYDAFLPGTGSIYRRPGRRQPRL